MSDDAELDALIFGSKEKQPNKQKKKAVSTPTDRMDEEDPKEEEGEPTEQELPDDIIQSDNEAETSKPSILGGVGNVLPMDKLKNGAATASKLYGSIFTKVKESTSAGWNQAKSSSAGSSLSSGWSRAKAKSNAQLAKLKETEAYKKTTETASSAWGKTSVAASIGWEKTKAGAAHVGESLAPTLEKAKTSAAVGLEKAKSTASSGIDAVKSKVGKDGKDGK